jgi:hypothetical protein
MKYNRFYRSPDADGSGGDDDLPPGTVVTPAPGEPSKADPPMDEPDTGDTGVYPDGTLKDGYVNHDGKVMKQTDVDAAKADEEDEDPDAITAEDALDKDGKLREGFLKDKDGKYTIDPDYETEPTDKEFYEKVHSLTGLELNVDYGDIDPLAPEGVAKREQAAYELGAVKFEEYLEKSNPRAYAFMMHTNLGGSEEDFLATAAPSLPTREDFEESSDMKADWIKRDYMSKGVPEVVVDATIKELIKNNTLDETALKLYNNLETVQKDQLDALQAYTKENEINFRRQVDAVLGDVTKTISSTELMVDIPQAKRTEFEQYVVKHIGHNESGFFLTQQLAPDTLPDLIAGMYLQFSKGDLSAIVNKKAKTVATQRLRLRLKADKALERGGGSPPKPKDDYVPLGEL